jgi:hypothetical protein
VITWGIEIDGKTFVPTFDLDLNQSRVQLFNACKRKFYWQFVENLIPERPAYHLSVGTAVHTALALVHTGKSVEEALSASLKEFDTLLPKKKVPGDEEIIEENRDIIRQLVPAYVAEYADEETPWIPLGVEVAGRVEVGDNTGIYLVFRTDQIVSWNNQLWIIDHKTAKKLDLRDLMKYEMDLQFSAYVYGVTCLLQKAIAGIIVNVLVKTKVPQFARQLYTRSHEELKEFEAEFVEIGNEIRWRMARIAAGEDPKVVFYKNTAQCFNYGTCWYRDLCLKDTEIRRMAFIKRKEDYVDEHAKNRTVTAADAGESTGVDRSS